MNSGHTGLRNETTEVIQGSTLSFIFGYCLHLGSDVGDILYYEC